MKTPDDDRHEIENILIGNIFCGYVQENRMIDVCEKLFDIALEHPHRPNVVLRNNANEFSESAESAVRTFPVLAGVRVGNKRLREKWRQLPVQCVMQKPVPNAGFMNITRFRIGDFEMLICRVRIYFGGKLAMKRDDVRHQISLEFLHVFARSLAADKFFPRLEEIFERNDIIICMLKSNFGHNGGNQPTNQ